MFTNDARNKRRRAWGHEFEWTDEHMTAEQMRPLIFSYDVLASECLDRLESLSGHPLMGRRKKKMEEKEGELSKPPSPGPRDDAGTGGKAPEDARHHPDLYQLLQQHAHSDDKLQELWTQVNTVPDWVDWAQIERGQKVSYRYAGPSIVALTFQSLLGGMGSRRVVETLTRTGGFGKHVTRRRLLETFQHILDVTRDLESVRPGGKGFASSIRVRFLHAAVRRRILQLAAEDPTYYSVEELGIPVNDLDSIGTVLTFSATLIWLGFPRQGIFLRSQEVSDYLALWRWVGYVLGAPTEPYLSSPAHAKAMMDSLIVSGEIAPTATSRTLANNIIAGLQGQPPMNASADFLRAEAHWLNGTELATALAIPKPPLYYAILVAGQCLLLATLCYLKRSIPPWDEANIRRLRRLIHKITLDQFEDKKEAAFEFQYIPNFGKVTEGDSGSTTTTTQEKERPGMMAAFWARNKSVERRNLHAVLVASAVMGWIAWLGLKSAASLLQ